MDGVMQVRRHFELTTEEIGALERHFDSEYLNEFGAWDSEQPYGYSPADTHVLAFHGRELVAHVGFQRRLILVGTRDILVAGTGGVLVDKRFRGTGIGRQTMRCAQTVMRDDAGIEFGFLGCREEVVPFYESAGWVRIYATERSLSRLDQSSKIVSAGAPNLVCSVKRHASEWPEGDIDLRGTPW